MGNGGDVRGIFPAEADQSGVLKLADAFTVTERNRPRCAAFDWKELVGNGSYRGGLGMVASAQG